MIILSSADWHVHPWSSYSLYDDLGVPSRLALFRTFAQDLISLCKSRGCTSAIIPGDILQTHSPKPMVSNVVRAIFNDLADAGIHVIVIPGNHDVDQKSGRFDPIHSGLAPILDGIRNLTYVPEPATVILRNAEGEEIPVYCHPWVHGAPDYEKMAQETDAKLFVGHGLVQGAVDPHSHIFTNGYDAKALSRIFTLSMIGDIHCSQVLKGEGTGRVLIPGQPMPINHSSDPNCGVWFYDTEGDSLEFVPTKDFPSSNQYHFFHTVDVLPESNDNPLIHYKRKVKKTKVTTSSEPVVQQIAKVDFLKLALDEFHSFKPAYPSVGEEIIKTAYESVRGIPPRSNIPTNQRLGKLSIRDFYSIGEFDIDLSEVEGDVLIVGNNGHGKSSLVEAVFWCITGETTKKTPVTEISNFFTKQPANVSLEILDGKTLAKITRSRDTSNLLTFEINGSNVSKASASETQELIYNFLGLQNAEDILTLVYFSVKKNESFTSMVPSKQFEFLSRLIDSDQFEEFQRILSLDADQAVKDAADLQVQIRTSQSILETTIAQRDSVLNSNVESEVNRHLERIKEQYGFEFADKNAAILALDKIVSAMSNKINSCVSDAQVVQAESKVRESRSRVAELRRTLERLNAQSVEIINKYEKAASGTCPECKQAIHDENLSKVILAQATAVGKEIRDTRAALDQESAKTEELQKVVEGYSDSVATRRSFEFELSTAQSFIVDLNDVQVSDTGAQVQVLNDSIRNLEEKIKVLQDELEKSTPVRETLVLIKAKMLAKNSSLVSSMVAGVYSTLVDTVNELVGDKTVFHARAVVSGKKLDTKVSYRGGRETSIAGISAGETRLLDALFMLALNTLFERRFGLENGVLGIVFYDEILTYLDPEYTDIVISALQNMNTRTRFMITHDPVLMSYYNRMLRANKVKGLTQYERVNF